DLVESTQLSIRLDPEDHREVLRTYQSAGAKVITRYDGYIAQYLGDGIMAYFGYPKAHEDDAERSVLAGLGIVEEVAKINLHNLQIRTRVGIATGLVVVGDKIAKGMEWEIGVVGESPNLAARIQGLAQPGTVVIGPTTRQLLGGQFEYLDLGSHPFKGFARPVQAWQVLSARALDSRFKAVRTANSKMVDRRAEQALLKELGSKAAHEVCQTVLICGEAGIGKSRLARALAEWMGEQADAHLIEMQCSAYHTQSALFPAINALWQIIFEGDRQRDGGLAWETLAGFLRETLPGEADEALPLFANLLSIPLPEDYPAPLWPPEQQRQLSLRYLLDLFVRCGKGNPVLLLMEDLHWADPSTLEFVDYIVEQGGSRPLLALFTSRPDFAPPWVNRPCVTVVPLGRLPNEDSAELVRQTLGEQGLENEIIESVVAKTDGIPLYLMEYTKAVAETRRPDAARDGRRASAIPSTLHDLLLARLDRLGEAKAVAQLAALLGREFDGKLLEAVWASDLQSLRSSLWTLLKEEVVYAKGEPGQQRYVFRHALIQDAAYESLLKSNRAALHRRIGEVVERDFPDTAATEPEWLAQHFSSAGLPLRAIPYWEQAGQRAGKLAAFAEASRHFQAALAQVALLPEEPSRHAMELGLQLQLALALSASRGYAVDEVEATYQRARELCGLLGDTAELFPVLRGLVSFYLVRCDLAKALELAEQCARLGQESGRPDYQIEACNALGYVLGYGGELKRGAEVLAEGIRTYRALDGERFEYPSPHDPFMGCLSMLSVLALLFGEARQAIRYGQELQETLERRNRPFDQAFGYNFLAFQETLRGRFGIAARHAGQASEISRRFGYMLWLDAANAHRAVAEGHLALAEDDRGALAGAITALKASINARTANGALLSQESFFTELAEAYQKAGEPWLALAAIEEAFVFVRDHGERWFLAENHRIRGELLISQGEREKGEANLKEALRVAESQGAKLFQLRAALSLHQHAQGMDGEIESRALLEEVVSSIAAEDGACIPEWREAARRLTPFN
ncbi:partial Adenylate cyclase 1, partial [Gammaproteobacteria bacterium]